MRWSGSPTDDETRRQERENIRGKRDVRECERWKVEKGVRSNQVLISWYGSFGAPRPVCSPKFESSLWYIRPLSNNFIRLKTFYFHISTFSTQRIASSNICIVIETLHRIIFPKYIFFKWCNRRWTGGHLGALAAVLKKISYTKS